MLQKISSKYNWEHTTFLLQVSLLAWPFHLNFHHFSSLFFFPTKYLDFPKCAMFSPTLYICTYAPCVLKIYSSSSFFLFSYTGSALQPIGSVVGVCGLVSHGMWDFNSLNRNWTQLEGGFLTTGLPGKSQKYSLFYLATYLSFQRQSRVNLLDHPSLGW